RGGGVQQRGKVLCQPPQTGTLRSTRIIVVHSGRLEVHAGALHVRLGASSLLGGSARDETRPSKKKKKYSPSFEPDKDQTNSESQVAGKIGGGYSNCKIHL